MSDILDGLTAKDKQELYNRLAFELRDDSLAAFSADESDLWDGMLEALRVAAKARQPLATFAGKVGRSKYAEQAASVRAYLDTSCAPVIRRPQRQAVLRTLLGCLVSHLTTRAIPTTPQVLFNSLGVLPFAVDQRFPGYAGARLLHRVAVMS